MDENTTIPLIKTREGAITKLTGDGLTGPNWVTWRVRMMSLLALCEIESYVRGEIPQPNRDDDPVGHDNWKKNDNYAKHLITQNVANEPLVHIQHGSTSHTAWHNLEAIYEDKSQETAVAVIRNLWHTTAEEGDDISEHLTTLKKYWERLNLVDDSNFRIPEVQFKIAIISSLPTSWDSFTRPYISVQKGDTADPKTNATSQELIGVLKEENVRRLRRSGQLEKQETVHQACAPKPSLSSRIEDRCSHCGSRNHKTNDCWFRGQPKCGICERFGHRTEDCYSKKVKGIKRKWETKPGGNGGKKKRFGDKKKREEANEGEEMDDNDDEHIVFTTQVAGSSRISFDPSEEGINFDKPDVSNSDEFDERLIFYNWLADSATTSHVCNQREAFTSFHPLTATKVTGVGNLVTKAEGRGTVELTSWCNGHKYILQLENVLYIPNNRNNLISLGKWDQGGRRFTGGGGVLTLITKDGTSVARGTKVGNNLYKMKVAIREPNTKPHKNTTVTPQTFLAAEPAQNWETWHKRFGHTSYGRLQHMLDNNLVEGFSVDMRTQKPDCIACTESKQTVEPFGKSTERKTEPGELTHIDLWGKYSIASINGNQYYILFVDDAERFSTTEFLKQKGEASQKVIEYLTHLKTQGRKPKAIRVDRGKEFVNDDLKTWCWQQGIEIHMTAPYSPSQNGIAERMNRTIVKPARAMLRGLPEFLWEYAVSHSSYLRNQTYTRTLDNKTPYEMRFKRKPNVSHLREFGAPVWVLLQGQKVPRKMESKSRRRVFVGYSV
jgi:hypothetical protein